MQEHQVLTGSHPRAQVHLPGPAGFTNQQLVTQGHGLCHGLVATTAIDDDYFTTAVALA